VKCTLVFLPVWKPLTPPLQLASLKASLLASGIQCRARDYTVTVCPGPGASFVDDATLEAEVVRDEAALAAWTQEILTDAPEVVGFSVVTSNLEVTRAVARRLRQAAPAVTIVCGGPASSGKTLTARAHACSWVSLISPRYSTCRWLTRPSASRRLSTILQ